MADFKSVIAKLQDNDKSAVYMNSLKGFKSKKVGDEITFDRKMKAPDF